MSGLQGRAARPSELRHLTLSDLKRPACMLNRFLGQAARLQRLLFLAGSIATARASRRLCKKDLRTKPRKYRI
jgi:hypothetical protein